jgi:cytochrome c
MKNMRVSLCGRAVASTKLPKMALLQIVTQAFRAQRKELMKSLLILATALGALASSAPALASADLAQKKNCMACHAADKKLIGPAYKDVAAKYAGQKDAAGMLAQKILKGGSGVWGAVPMPANPQVNDAEAKQLAAWVLSTK